MGRAARDRLYRVRDAFRALFRLSPSRTESYRDVFTLGGGGLNPAAQVVLADLRRICFVDRSTAHKDAMAMAVAEGRRQVFLHIIERLELTDDVIQQATAGDDEDLLL